MTGIALSGKGSGDGSTVPIDQAAAQLLALTVNAQHGLPRDSATKRRQVEAALNMENLAGKSDREIAKLCNVYHTLAASIRNPEAKKRQAKNLVKHVASKVGDELQSGVDSTPALNQDYGPDENELRASELAQQANIERFQKMLDENPAIAEAYEECTRMNLIQARLEVRIAALMTEKNEAVKQAKRVQTQIYRQRKLNKLAGATPASNV